MFVHVMRIRSTDTLQSNFIFNLCLGITHIHPVSRYVQWQLTFLHYFGKLKNVLIKYVMLIALLQGICNLHWDFSFQKKKTFNKNVHFFRIIVKRCTALHFFFNLTNILNEIAHLFVCFGCCFDKCHMLVEYLLFYYLGHCLKVFKVCKVWNRDLDVLFIFFS